MTICARSARASIVERAELEKPSGKPLEAERWAGCIDAVGGGTLPRC